MDFDPTKQKRDLRVQRQKKSKSGGISKSAQKVGSLDKFTH